MFEQCEAEELDLRSFDTSGCTNFDCMFLGSKAKVLDVSTFDMTEAQYVAGMFADMGNIGTLDLSTFTLTKVHSAVGMFRDCGAKLIKLPLIKSQYIKTLAFMFKGCLADELDLKTIDTRGIISMTEMFADCRSRLLNLDTFNTMQVEDMYGMFEGYRYEELDLSSFDTSKVSTMARMFYNCKAKIADAHIASFNTSSLKNITDMFTNSTITTIPDQFNTPELQWKIDFPTIEIDKLKSLFKLLEEERGGIWLKP